MDIEDIRKRTNRTNYNATEYSEWVATLFEDTNAMIVELQAAFAKIDQLEAAWDAQNEHMNELVAEVASLTETNKAGYAQWERMEDSLIEQVAITAQVIKERDELQHSIKLILGGIK